MLMGLAAPTFATGAPAISEETEKAAIQKVIADMEVAWNRGDFRGYMDGFLNPGVVFVSRGRFQAVGRVRWTTTSATTAALPRSAAA